MNPNGQSQPQTVRPNSSPKRSISPKTQNGKRRSTPDKELCNAPKGQAPKAPGQE